MNVKQMIGIHIAELRNAKGLTQEQLAGKMGAIVNSCVWDSGGDPFFFNTINEFHSLNNICQALRTM